jgi:hypothetical protein
MKIVNWIKDTSKWTEHSLYKQEASGTRQGYRRKTALRDSAPETRTAVISGRVASGPSSPVAVSGPSSPDARYSDTSPRSADAKKTSEGDGEPGTVRIATNNGKEKQRCPVSSDASLKLITV